jgi:hypothetical protein
MPYNLDPLIAELGLTTEDLHTIQQLIRQDFPHDEMMYALHLFRTLRALKDGLITLDEACGREKLASGL